MSFSLDTHARYFVESAPLYPVLFKKYQWETSSMLERMLIRTFYQTFFLTVQWKKVLYNASFLNHPIRKDLYIAMSSMMS